MINYLICMEYDKKPKTWKGSKKCIAFYLRKNIYLGGFSS